MVEAVRSGQSQRQVAKVFGVSAATVAHWVAQAGGARIDRVGLANRKPGRAWNRTSARVEQRIVRTRRELRDKSVLGEYGADAIGLALRARSAVQMRAAPVPARATFTGFWSGMVHSMRCAGNAGPPRPRAGICLIWPPPQLNSTALTSLKT